MHCGCLCDGCSLQVGWQGLTGGPGAAAVALDCSAASVAIVLPYVA